MKEKRSTWGIILILSAVFVILNQYNIFGSINLFKILLTVVLAMVALSGAKHRDFPTAIFPVAFMAIIYDNQLGITNLTPWPILLAALLLSIGLSMLFPRSRFYKETEKRIDDFAGKAAAYKSTTSDSEVRYNVSMASGIKYINSTDFKSATLHSSFAGSKIYFDSCKVPSGHAVIDVDLSFSGMEIYIPREWNLITNVNCFLGGIDTKGTPSQVGGPTIELVGNTKFSGITIFYV